MDKNDTYLGDGLYASYDGFGYTLYAWDGVTRTDQVYLEPAVLDAFNQFVDRMKV